MSFGRISDSNRERKGYVEEKETEVFRYEESAIIELVRRVAEESKTRKRTRVITVCFSAQAYITILHTHALDPKIKRHRFINKKKLDCFCLSEPASLGRFNFPSFVGKGEKTISG